MISISIAHALASWVLAGSIDHIGPRTSWAAGGRQWLKPSDCSMPRTHACVYDDDGACVSDRAGWLSAGRPATCITATILWRGVRGHHRFHARARTPERAQVERQTTRLAASGTAVRLDILASIDYSDPTKAT